MFSSFSAVSNMGLVNNGPTLTYNAALLYNTTNAYTDSASHTWTNYVYQTCSGVRCLNLNNWTGTLCFLVVAGGGSGGCGSSSGGGGGGGGQLVCVKYELVNFTDTVTITVAGQATPTATGVNGVSGGNTTITFGTNTSFNITAVGGGGGGVNATTNVGLAGGCGGGCGRSATSLSGLSTTGNYIGGSTVTIGSSVATIVGYGNASLSNSTFTSASYAGPGAGCGGQGTGAVIGTSYSIGGDGLQPPSGYGVSTYLGYGAGGGGSGNVGLAGGKGGKYGGGCGGGSAGGSSPDSGYYSGYGATDDSGTGATTSLGGSSSGYTPGSGSYGGGGGGGTGTTAKGGAGLIIMSIY